MTFSFMPMYSIAIFRNRLLLVRIPDGHSARNLMLRTDIIKLGHAMTDRCAKAADMAGVTTHDTLHKMLGVTRFVTLTTEV